MNANDLEIESKALANHLIYVYTKLKMKSSITAEIKSASIDYYGCASKVDEWTALLCSTLKGLSQADTDLIVYDAKDAHSRSLADWWEKHQAWDKKREADEKKLSKAEKEAKKQKRLLDAINKLTPVEKKKLFDSLGV